MDHIRLEKSNNIYTLTLLAEGKFNDKVVNEVLEALDVIEKDEEDISLILTGEGKNFSQGYDIEFLNSYCNNVDAFIEKSLTILSRLLTFRTPSIAAINGHAFGLGAMLALACDIRCMREDRGYFCLPEVDLGVGFHPFMTALIKAKLPASTVTEATLSGKRFNGTEASDKQIVDSVSSLDELYTHAQNLIAPYTGKNKAIYSRLKTSFNSSIIEHLK